MEHLAPLSPSARRDMLRRVRNVYLCGFMGCGKTTVGRLLAKHWGWPFVDTDAVIEKQEGFSISELFSRFGEPRFREIEAGVVANVTAHIGQIVALGGGALLDEASRERVVDSGRLIGLSVPANVLYERLRNEWASRPLLSTVPSHLGQEHI